MASPSVVNAPANRALHARRHQANLHEADYLKPSCAFGRAPIAIYLRGFLQLKPAGSGVTLLSDTRKLAAADSRPEWPPVEHQRAMKFFCVTSLRVELQATDRFKDAELAELMNLARRPVPDEIANAWGRAQMKPDDPRLGEERFQTGHAIARC